MRRLSSVVNFPEALHAKIMKYVKPISFKKLAILTAGFALANICQAAGDVGITDTKILIGQSAAFSGPAAQLGIQMNAGAKAYFDHVNAYGGIYGRHILLITAGVGYQSGLALENT